MTPPTTKLKLALLAEERSAAWLGRQLGVTRASSCAWVGCREMCPRARRAQIAALLDVPLVELFDEEGWAKLA